mmetsp:Transcript_105708/g.329458  ORF Transcript_105708/g.329458 Transcript_105708/m.329458 type:complete len:255 (-) Transcript_105708:240-1004(-)
MREGASTIQDAQAPRVVPTPDLAVAWHGRRHRRDFEQLEEVLLQVVPEAFEDLQPSGPYACVHGCSLGLERLGHSTKHSFVVCIQGVEADYGIVRLGHFQPIPPEKSPQRRVDFLDDVGVEELGPRKGPASRDDLGGASAAALQPLLQGGRQKHHPPEALHLVQGRRGHLWLVIRLLLLGGLLLLLRGRGGVVVPALLGLGVHPSKLLLLLSGGRSTTPLGLGVLLCRLGAGLFLLGPALGLSVGLAVGLSVGL